MVDFELLPPGKARFEGPGWQAEYYPTGTRWLRELLLLACFACFVERRYSRPAEHIFARILDVKQRSVLDFGRQTPRHGAVMGSPCRERGREMSSGAIGVEKGHSPFFRYGALSLHRTRTHGAIRVAMGLCASGRGHAQPRAQADMPADGGKAVWWGPGRRRGRRGQARTAEARRRALGPRQTPL